MKRRTLLAVIATLTAACDQSTAPPSVAPNSPSDEVAAVVGPNGPYSGRATAVNATVLALSIKKCDTGPLPASGGYINNSYPTYTVPGILSIGSLWCETRGANGAATSESSIFHMTLTVGGHRIFAEVLPSMARAACNGSTPYTVGHSHIVRLLVNGKQHAITGSPNQTIYLPNGYIRINEQNSANNGFSAFMTVTALHVVINGLVVPIADLKFSTSHADIDCP